jgi:hypothetical protein
VILEFWTQDLALARDTCYHMSHVPNPQISSLSLTNSPLCIFITLSLFIHQLMGT